MRVVKGGSGLWRNGSQGTCGALLGLALLCGAQSVSAQVSLSDAWVRALPPTQSTTAAYVTVHNSGPDTVSVVGGHTELAGKLEVHRSVEENGYMRMLPVPDLPVAAGDTVELAPGGVHLMLLDLKRMPAEGESVTFCLTLGDGSEACTEARVQRGPAGDMDHSQHH